MRAGLTCAKGPGFPGFSKLAWREKCSRDVNFRGGQRTPPGSSGLVNKAERLTGEHSQPFPFVAGMAASGGHAGYEERLGAGPF